MGIFLMNDEEALMLEKARRLANFCHNNNFAGSDVLKGMKVSEMRAIYNGIGPNFSADVILKIGRHINPLFEPAGFLLDLAYWREVDRSPENFHKVNRQFYENCKKCVTLKYGFLNPKRYCLFHSAKVLWKKCECEGWENWKSGLK